MYYKKIIDSFKRRDTAPVYLFYGQETYLKKHVISQIKELMFSGVNSEFNIVVFDAEETEVSEIVNSANALPFMFGQKLMIVKNTHWFKSGKSKDDDMNMLLDYIKNPNPTTCLIFDAGEEIDKRKKIFKTIEKYGRVINFEKLNLREIAMWLDMKLKRYNKTIEPAARELLLGAASGIMWLANELDKLINYVGDNSVISEEDVKQVVYFPLEYHIFNVIDAIGECRHEDSLKGIKTLLMNKEQPQVILAMVARQFRLMLLTQELMDRGLQANEITKQIKEKPYPVKKAMKLCKNFTKTQLINSIKQLSDLDLDIKTGRQTFYEGLGNILLRNAL